MSEGESVGLRAKSDDVGYGEHIHEFIEMIYISDGEGSQFVDGVEYSVKRGDMLFVNYGATHSFVANGTMSYIEIYFSPKLVENGVITPENAIAMLALSSFDGMRAEKSGGMVSFTGQDMIEVEFILGAMKRECERSSAPSRNIMESYVNILIAMMLRRASSEDELLAEDMWQSMKSYIDSNPEEKMTLSSLSSKVFYNPSYFSRVFKRKFGVSPMEYLRERRFERAAVLLSSTDDSVDDIIERVGFTDRSSFYHLFAKRFGRTPSEYRDSAKCKKSKQSE
jgi:AraC-like DNA-binding protein